MTATEKSTKIDCHFIYETDAGPLKHRTLRHLEGVARSFNMAVACTPNLKTLPKYATNEPEAASCTRCRATDAWKKAMASVLTERGVPTDDEQWDSCRDQATPESTAPAATVVLDSEPAADQPAPVTKGSAPDSAVDSAQPTPDQAPKPTVV